MKKLVTRRTSGIGVFLLLMSLVMAVGLPVAATNDNRTQQKGGWDVNVTSGAWGTITDNGNDSVSVTLNAGYSLELCVKGGNGFAVYTVTSSGGTFWPPADCGNAQRPRQCGLSHWGIRKVVLTTTSTTAQETTSTQPPTLVLVPGPETGVLGIQVSAPEAAQVNQVTQETLPFTGISTGSMALLAAAFAGAGLLLPLAARQNDERTPVRSWNP